MSGETKVVAVEADGLTASLVVEPSKDVADVSLYVDGSQPVVAILAARNRPIQQVDMGNGAMKWIDLQTWVTVR